MEHSVCFLGLLGFSPVVCINAKVRVVWFDLISSYGWLVWPGNDWISEEQCSTSCSSMTAVMEAGCRVRGDSGCSFYAGCSSVKAAVLKLWGSENGWQLQWLVISMAALCLMAAVQYAEAVRCCKEAVAVMLRWL